MLIAICKKPDLIRAQWGDEGLSKDISVSKVMAYIEGINDVRWKELRPTEDRPALSGHLVVGGIDADGDEYTFTVLMAVDDLSRIAGMLARVMAEMYPDQMVGALDHLDHPENFTRIERQKPE